MSIQTFDFGPRADQLPGPEVLGTFDPETVIPGTQATTVLPEHPNCYLRWFPHKGSQVGLVPFNEALREEHIRTAQRHFDAIQRESESALVIPSHRSFAAPHPRYIGQPAILTVVEKVNGDRGVPDDPRSAAALYANAKYLQWVVGTRQPQILTDNFWAGQSLLGHPNYQTDIDAFLAQIDNHSARVFATVLDTWFEHVAPYEDTTPYVGHAATALAEVKGMLAR